MAEAGERRDSWALRDAAYVGGGEGIRTPGTVTGSAVFKTPCRCTGAGDCALGGYREGRYRLRTTDLTMFIPQRLGALHPAKAEPYAGELTGADRYVK